MDEYYEFIKTAPKKDVDAWLENLDIAYASGKETIADEVYDELVRAYETRFGKRTVVGAPVQNLATGEFGNNQPGGAVKLPIAMMSLDKIMKEKELLSFMAKNPGPYVVMDKINGNAGLYEIMNGSLRLYNRGDGTIGNDLTHVLRYLNLPVLDFNVHIKGELVVDKADYQPYKKDYKTNLSMVAGLLNSLSADPERLKLIRFIAYDMSFPNNPEIELSPSQTLQYLQQYGFATPYASLANELTIPVLSEFYKQRKEDAVYDIDGVVIVQDRPIKYEERVIRKNPKYSVAYKEYGNTLEATVNSVLWEASKHGVIKPVVKVEPVAVGNGYTIRSLTAFNAKWIVDNQVGPGTKLAVTHNTIPYILGVITPTYAEMPPVEIYPAGSWQWNETNVDIVLLEDTDEVLIARIYEFFKQLGAKYWGEATLAKFYNAGFDTIKKMLETNKEEFLAEHIEGVGAGTVDRMIRTRNEALLNVNLAQLMSASGMFGLGFGQRKLKKITDLYPNILDLDLTIEDITNIDGFAAKTAQRFIDGLPKFKAFLADIPILQQALLSSQQQQQLMQQQFQQTMQQPQFQQTMQQPQFQQTMQQPQQFQQPQQLTQQPQQLTTQQPQQLTTQQPQQLMQSLAGKSVVFTGFRDKELENNIRYLGGDVKTGVSRKVDYVLVGGPKGVGSAKERKAIEYGIPVMSVAEFKSNFGLS